MAALIFFILLDPYWKKREREGWVGVLVDTSASMNVRDEAGGRSRWESLALYLSKSPQWEKFRSQHVRKSYRFDTKLAGLGALENLTPSEKESRLFSALHELDAQYQRDPALLGWIVFSDGAATDMDAAQAAGFSDLHFPCIAVGLGSHAAISNLSLESFEAKRKVFSGESFAVRVSW